MVKYFEGYKPVVTKRVLWLMLGARWYKCNTDGACRGNPGPSLKGFYVKNDAGDLVFAKAEGIGSQLI